MAFILRIKTREQNYSRITFNEITKTAVKDSIKHARDIDMNLVDAQQARRVLDRIVGYQISPILWAKIKRGLSAGRVQSVALRLICDREEEINLFIPQEYWSLEALLDVKGSKKPLEAKLIGNKEQKIEIHSEEEMNEILSYLKERIHRRRSESHRTIKEEPTSIYDKYSSAGCIQQVKLRTTENNAYRTAVI